MRTGFSQLAAGVDLVVLAQASMADAMNGGGLDAPFLTSPELGMATIARKLKTA